MEEEGGGASRRIEQERTDWRRVQTIDSPDTSQVQVRVRVVSPCSTLLTPTLQVFTIGKVDAGIAVQIGRAHV